MKYDYLIVGAGYAGSIMAERIASQLDKKVLVVDKRDHIAGNAYDYFDSNGVLNHKYGPHIFHTSSAKVKNYLSQFTEWQQYMHRVLAVIEGKKVPIPFNLNSIYELFPPKYAGRLEDKLTSTYGYGIKIPILKLRQTEDTELKFLADYIYKNVFLGYTTKQWGYKPEELDYSVSSRIPVYISRDNRYFQDTHQQVPKYGYTEMFKKILSHKNIHVLLNADYKDVLGLVNFNRIIYTGPIDTFFDYMHGELPYRSLRFRHEQLEKDFFQEVMQVNYPNNYDYTRTTEVKHLTGQKTPFTSVAYEFPEQYEKGKNDPYYPIPKDENHEKYGLYLKEAEKLGDTVHFVGRLADYKYYNMDQITGVTLQRFEKFIAKTR
jgi:UDP-galactopyranose mutase